VCVVADLVRNYGPDRGMRWLHELSEVQELGVIGIGTGGAEQEFPPPEPYEKVYAQARQFGFRTSAHAGEAAGAESIWGAIRALEVDRIGHGTRAIEDPELLSYLLAKQIPVEACPISNPRMVVGMVMTFVVSLAMPFPWTLSQTLIAVAIASFVGSVISFQRGWAGGKAAD